MKTYKNIAFFFITLLTIQCKAQTPIIDLNDRNGEYTNGAYYKDTNNLLNQFEGTYIMNDGVNYLKIVFKKKTMQLIGNIYEDILIGEYQYKKNGVEVINTLSNFTQNLPNATYHAIHGNHFLNHHTPFDDYTTDNFRLTLGMYVPNGITATVDIRKAVVSGQEAIQIFKRTKYYHKKGQTVPPVIVPNGFFYLIKQ